MKRIGTRCRAGLVAGCVLVALVAGAGTGGCADSGGTSGTSGTAGSSSRIPSAASSRAVVPGAPGAGLPGIPAADAAVPMDAGGTADALTRTTGALDRAIDGWVSGGGGARGRPPQPVVLLALYQQRIYRVLARRPDLARRAIARLPGPLAGAARDNVAATRGVIALARPTTRPKPMRTGEPLPAATLLGYLRRAGDRFGVSWQVLAAVMHVETKFGRVRSASSAGAQGPMQFLPATWEAYGLGGDIHDPRDAVMGAANYLHASGAPGDYARALYAYNPDRRYVDAVLRHARRMRSDRRAFYAYYNWQVFVLTTSGDARVTGPPPLDGHP